MSATEAAFLVLVFTGVLALLAAMILTRLHWRQDIPPFGLRTSFLDVTLHPERYASAAPFGIIRSASAIGAVLLAGAVAVVVWEIVRTMLKS